MVNLEKQEKSAHTKLLKERHERLLSVLNVPRSVQGACKALIEMWPDSKIDPTTVQVHLSYLRGAGIIARSQLSRKYMYCTCKKTLIEHVRSTTMKTEACKHIELLKKLTKPLTIKEMRAASGVEGSKLNEALRRLNSLGLVRKEVKGRKVSYIRTHEAQAVLH